MTKAISDYGLIGDLHTAALVHRDGSIDWMCLPRFDSEACFASLLGDEDNGRWWIGSSDPKVESKRRYLGSSLVLETTHTTGSGSFRVIDFMPPRAAHPCVIRVVEGLSGKPTVEMDLRVRFTYGKAIPWVRRIPGGRHFIVGPNGLVLYTAAKLEPKGFSTTSTFTVEPLERVSFVLMHHESTSKLPSSVSGDVELERTLAYWKAWVDSCHEEFGEYHAMVTRSAITLKALTYDPSGGIVAAATTSLPEALGGPRNWDYRYCWLRDATFTLYALLLDGHETEALHWRDWLLRAAAGDPSQLQIMYGIGGERLLVETELPWLSGFENSKPVRIGNAASEQFQLDVYGELLDSLYLFYRLGVPLDNDSWSLQVKLANFVEAHWQEPDEGIWEVRGPRRHFTHSKAMAWVALDRVIKVAQAAGTDAPLDRWIKARSEIHHRVMSEGYNEEVGAFTQYFGSKTLDASVLLLPLVGFIDPKDPRMISTVHAIEKTLMRDGLVLRYGSDDDSVDGLPPGEGLFLACSFWYVDNLMLSGDTHKAHEVFRRIIAMSNDLGLFSEEYDTTTGVMLGNFPQAFSHVGLINSVRNLTHTHPPAHHRADDNFDHRLPHVNLATSDSRRKSPLQS